MSWSAASLSDKIGGMANLIEQLQADAIDREVPITDLLRKAKIAAVKLGQMEFAKWIELETNGYLHGEEVPPYRRLSAEMKFFNPVRGWCPIIGWSHERICRQSVAEVSALLDGSKGNQLMAGVGREIVEQISQEVGFDVDVKSWVSGAATANILDAVRNAVLDWTLKLEQAGVRGQGLSFSPAEAARARNVTINIGSIGNATGIGAFGDHAAISSVQAIIVESLSNGVLALSAQVETQIAALPKEIAGAVEKVVAELREEALGKRPDEGRMRRGLESLGRIMEGAAGNLAAAGVIAAITRLLGG